MSASVPVVLHVDPDDTSARDLQRALERSETPFELRRERRSVDALERVREGGIDCVVAEQSLPDGAGLDLLDSIRARDPELPVILFTAAGDEAVAAAAIGAGVTDYFRKADPDSLESIPGRLRRAIANHHASMAARERTRELTALHGTSAALIADRPLDERLQQVVDTLKMGFQRPESVATAIDIDGIRYRTVDYPATEERPVSTATATAGGTTVEVRVIVLDSSPVAGDHAPSGDESDPVILPEEETLLRSVAEMVAVHVDRASTAERLRAFAQRLETILEHTTNLVFMRDLSGRYVLVNDAYSDFLGMTRDEILGRKTDEVHGERVADWIAENDAETLAAGKPRQFEERYPRADGIRRFVTVRVPLFDAADEPYAIYGIATDVTEELRLAEERTELLDRMTDAFLALDVDGRVSYCNARAAAVLDVPPAELIDTDLSERLSGLGWSEVLDGLSTATKTGEPETLTTLIEPLDRWFDVRIYPADSGVSIYLSDVTEARTERAEIERREATMRRLYGVIADTGMGFEGKVRALLALGKEILGVESGLFVRSDGESQEVVVAADTTREFTAGDVLPPGIDICERVGATGRTVRATETPTTSTLEEDDDDRVGCYVGSPIMVDGTLYGALCLYDRESRSEPFREWDLTLIDLMTQWMSHEIERRDAETEVARERDRLEAFAGMVSHDLRSPLNVAAGHIDLVRERDDDESLRRAARALDRMNELIEDALSFARLGSKVVDLEAVDLTTVANEAWSTVETAEATLVVRDPGVVAGDASRVRTLLENLFRNAIEHGGEGVTVTVGRSDHGFFVADDGPGIAAEHRERVFELGYSTNRAGTGFGLGIVAQIAEAHGWSVRLIDSTDGGAQFTFDGVSHVVGTSTRR